MKIGLLVLSLMITPLSYADYYGAIAIDKKTGSVGWSYDYGTQSGAEAAALSECKGKCEVALWFANTCGAVAHSAKQKVYGWAYADTSGEAENMAKSYCEEKDCKVVASVCTSWDYYY